MKAWTRLGDEINFKPETSGTTTVSVYVNQRAISGSPTISGRSDAQVTFMINKFISFWRASSSAGQVLGPAVGALFAQLSLRTVFLGAGGILLLGGIVMFIALAETIGIGPAAVGDDHHNFLTDLRTRIENTNN
jgi:hypothetical protein